MNELLYLHNLKKLGQNGFSYFVIPEGYIGKSASYKLGIAQLTNTRCFFTDKINDNPVYIHKNSVWSPERLVDSIVNYNEVPKPAIRRNELVIHKMWEDLIIPSSVVATGAIIEHQPRNSKMGKEILLVKTHKWGNRCSIVGGKVRTNERLSQSLLREVKEETMLSGEIGRHITTFDQIKNSGYYKSGVSYIFIDNIVKTKSKRLTLNEDALKHLDIEPNARHTVKQYLSILNADSYNE
jgi:ADP-ribose pyrophosphatase YjhB (NUDIX family)